jgi:hypothetical protein
MRFGSLKAECLIRVQLLKVFFYSKYTKFLPNTKKAVSCMLKNCYLVPSAALILFVAGFVFFCEVQDLLYGADL